MRRVLLGERGETAKVAEQHRADKADSTEVRLAVRVAHHLVDDGLGQEPREYVPHALPLDLSKPPLRQAGVDPGAQERGIDQIIEPPKPTAYAR